MIPRVTRAIHELLRTRPRLLLAVLAFASAVTLQPDGFGSVDALRRYRVTHALWAGTPFVAPGDFPENGVIGRGGVVHPWYGIGQSLVMLPADLIASAILASRPADPKARERAREILVSILTFPLLQAAIAIAAFALLAEVRLFSQSQITLGVLSLMFASSTFYWAQVHQENSLLLLSMLVGFWGTLRWLNDSSRRALAIAAIALGASLLIRLTSVLNIAWALVFMTLVLIGRNRLTDRRFRLAVLKDLTVVAIPLVVVSLLIDRIYQIWRFGWSEWTSTYMGIAVKQSPTIRPLIEQLGKHRSALWPYNASVLPGLLGPFADPQRMIWLTDPLFVLSLIALYAYARRGFRRHIGDPDVAAAASCAGLLISLVLFHAPYEFWPGTTAWGDRYVTLPLQVSALFAVPMTLRIEFWSTRLRRYIVGLFLLVSVAVSVGSVVLTADVEETQAICSQVELPLPMQRWKNIASEIGHTQDQWKLDCDRMMPSKYSRAYFMPFLIRDYISRSVYVTLVIAWSLWTAAWLFVVVLTVREVLGGELLSTRRSPSGRQPNEAVLT